MTRNEDTIFRVEQQRTIEEGCTVSSELFSLQFFDDALCLQREDMMKLYHLLDNVLNDTVMAENEKKVSYKDKILINYLERYLPTSPDDPNAELKTTMQIMDDLGDMAEFEVNEVAQKLAELNYTVACGEDGKPAWVVLDNR